MRWIAPAAALLLVSAMPALAAMAEVTDCAQSGMARLDAIAEPWEKNTRTFANDAVRVTVLDFGEPAAGGTYLVVQHPPEDETGWRHCRVISLAAGGGFSFLTLEGMTSGYDPRHGLLLSLSGRRHDPQLDQFVPLQLTLLVNQQTGALSAEWR